MRRLLAIVLVLLIALAGFYVAWPAWTAYQIRQSIEANDPAALERNIDFVSVRARAKPLVAAQMQQSLDELQRQAGPIGAAIAGQLRESLGATLADAAIDSILTPQNVIRLAREGKNISRALKDIARERASRGSTNETTPPTTEPTTSGGVPAPGAPAARQRHRLSLDNIKSYRITGPLTIEVGVALDPAASGPDVVAELAFSGGGWKVVGLVPQL
jgi:hypothetical protein